MVKKIQIVLSNKLLYMLITIVAVVAVSAIAVASWDTNKNMYHPGDDVKVQVGNNSDGSPAYYDLQSLIDANLDILKVPGDLSPAPPSCFEAHPLNLSEASTIGKYIIDLSSTSCTTTDGCIINLKSYDSSGKLMKSFSTTSIQNADNTWTSSYGTRKGTNGESIKSPIFSSGTYAWLSLYDDVSGTEIDSNQLTMIDNGAGSYKRAGYIQICPA